MAAQGKRTILDLLDLLPDVLIKRLLGEEGFISFEAARKAAEGPPEKKKPERQRGRGDRGSVAQIVAPARAAAGAPLELNAAGSNLEMPTSMSTSSPSQERLLREGNAIQKEIRDGIKIISRRSASGAAGVKEQFVRGNAGG